jgi:hypothetical protein
MSRGNNGSLQSGSQAKPTTRWHGSSHRAPTRRSGQLRQRLAASELLAVTNARVGLLTWLASQVSSLDGLRTVAPLLAAAVKAHGNPGQHVANETD